MESLKEWFKSKDRLSSTVKSDVNFLLTYMPAAWAEYPYTGGFDILRDAIEVIATHISRGREIPVISLTIDNGSTFTMRNNFIDWVVSVNSPFDVEMDFMGITDIQRSPWEFYSKHRFPENRIYGSYLENKRQFSFELESSTYHLYLFIWIYRKQILDPVWAKKR